MPARKFFSKVTLHKSRKVGRSPKGEAIIKFSGVVTGYDCKDEEMTWWTEPDIATACVAEYPRSGLYVEWYVGPDGKNLATTVADDDWADDALAAHIEAGGLHEDALLIACEKGWAKTVAALLQKGTDMSVRGVRADPPLILAAHRENSRIVKLLAPCCDVNERGIHDLTALHYAANDVSGGGARILLTAGASPDVKDVEGVTPLMLAAHYGNFPMIKMLVGLVDPRYKTAKRGDSAESFAREAGRIDVADYFKEACESLDFQDELKKEIQVPARRI